MHTRSWLVKTQKSTTKCSFVKIVVLRLTNQERMKNLILSWAHSLGSFSFGGVIIECVFFLQVDESMTGRASKRQFTVECLPSAYHSTTDTSAFNFGYFFNSL